jgi:hypothetical protein
MFLHQILTKATFKYWPCKDLLHFCKKEPTPEEWEQSSKKWLSLSADPYQVVSEQSLKLFYSYFHLTQAMIL